MNIFQGCYAKKILHSESRLNKGQIQFLHSTQIFEWPLKILYEKVECGPTLNQVLD